MADKWETGDVNLTGWFFKDDQPPFVALGVKNLTTGAGRLYHFAPSADTSWVGKVNLSLTYIEGLKSSGAAGLWSWVRGTVQVDPKSGAYVFTKVIAVFQGEAQLFGPSLR
jgi:hypothetical protein